MFILVVGWQLRWLDIKQTLDCIKWSVDVFRSTQLAWQTFMLDHRMHVRCCSWRHVKSVIIIKNRMTWTKFLVYDMCMCSFMVNFRRVCLPKHDTIPLFAISVANKTSKSHSKLQNNCCAEKLDSSERLIPPIAYLNEVACGKNWNDSLENTYVWGFKSRMSLRQGSVTQTEKTKIRLIFEQNQVFAFTSRYSCRIVKKKSMKKVFSTWRSSSHNVCWHTVEWRLKYSTDSGCL